MGFSENPQKYVKDVILYAIEEDWKYPSSIPDGQNSREVDFNHFVTVQFVDIAYSNEDEQGLISPTSFSFSKDMFYPAFIRTGRAAFLAIHFSLAALTLFAFNF